MSLFIAFTTQDSVIMMSDARCYQRIPWFGIKYYDYFQKLASLDKDKLWFSAAGFVPAAMMVFNKLKERKICNISALQKIDKSFFQECHSEALKQYNISLKEKDAAEYCLSILFGGLDENNKPLLCLINSYNNYKREWIENKYEFVMNKIDFGETDVSLKELASKIAVEIENRPELLRKPKKLLRYIDVKFRNITYKYPGIGPLDFFIKVSKNHVEYKEVRKIKRFLHGIRYNFHYLIFFKILKIHELNRTS